MKPWNLSKSWSMHVQEEFFQQGDKEKTIGLPVSMFMDRENYDQARMSLNFIDFIVEPLIAGLKQLLPQMDVPMNCLYYNRQQWSEIEEDKNSMEQQLAGSPEEEGHQERETGASDADKGDTESSDSGSVVEEDLDTMQQPQLEQDVGKADKNGKNPFRVGDSPILTRNWSIKNEVSRPESRAKSAWSDGISPRAQRIPSPLDVRSSSGSNMSQTLQSSTSSNPVAAGSKSAPLQRKKQASPPSVGTIPTMFASHRKRPTTAGGFYSAKRLSRAQSSVLVTQRKIQRQIFVSLDKLGGAV
jgi:hypothetical protein